MLIWAHGWLPGCCIKIEGATKRGPNTLFEGLGELSCCVIMGNWLTEPAGPLGPNLLGEGTEDDEGALGFQVWHSVNLQLSKAFSKAEFVSRVSGFEIQLCEKGKNPAASLRLDQNLFVLCEVTDCVLLPDYLGFSGKVPIARKWVLICALAIFQGTLWQNMSIFFRGSADVMTC